MRISPLFTLGSTSVGMIFWFWYSAGALSAAASKTPEANPVSRRVERLIAEATVNNLQPQAYPVISSWPEPSIYSNPKKSFSAEVLPTPIVSEVSLIQNLEGAAFSVLAEPDQAQVKTIVAQSLAEDSVEAAIELTGPEVLQDSGQPDGFSLLSAGVDENYVLGAGDIIAVDFFNVPEYSGQHRISTGGTINLPLIGRAYIRGLSVGQAGDAIASRYLSQLQSPIVTINVIQQRPLQVAISGEIVQPGLYSLGGTGQEHPRLFQALQQAGGVTQAANLTQIEVRRKEIDGTRTTNTINLLSLLQNGDIDQNIFLQDGDAIVIPSSTELDRVALNQLAGSNLRANTNQPVDIAVVGEVTQPGPYRMTTEGGSATLVQALQKAGGITASADLRKVQLRRQTRQGTEQVFDIDLWELLQSGDLSQDLALQQGDTLLVPTASELSVDDLTSLAASSLSSGTIRVNVVGEVESPGGLEVSANTSFNQALLASGGLNRRAQPEATLVRFNPNGTVDRQSIDIDLSQDINPDTNPILRPNDVIVVGRSGKAAFDDSISGLSRTFNLVWPFLLLL